MKELKTPNPLVIVLLGLPGAGKSTFAREFSNLFGAPVIESGLLRREIFGRAVPSKAHHDGLERAFWALAAEQFKSKRMFILDGHAGTRSERAQVRLQAKKAGYDCLFVWVQTSEPVALTRSLKPQAGATNLPLTEANFTKLVRSFEAPGAGEPHLVVSGQRTFASQARPILKKIAEGQERSISAPERPERPPRRNIFIR